MRRSRTISLSLQISAPKGMNARTIKREVLTRINNVCGHYDAFTLGLPDSSEDLRGNLKVKATLAKAKREESTMPEHDGNGVEYVFTLPNGEQRFEIVFERKDIFAFQKMHGAKSARPWRNVASEVSA